MEMLIALHPTLHANEAVKKMIKAYILAKIQTGEEEAIFRSLKKLHEIKRAAATFRIYDLAIEVNPESIEKLDDFIFTKLRKIQGITETMSLITSKTVVQRPRPNCNSSQTKHG